MNLLHEVPTALRVSPTVTLRPFPGKTYRVPARGGIIIVLAVLIWIVGVAFLHRAALPLAELVLVPAGLLTALIECKPRGKAPLAWAYVVIRHRGRPMILRHQRLAHQLQRPGQH